MNPAEIIRKGRKRAKLSQRALASKAKVSHRTIVSVENEQTPPNGDTLQKLAAGLGFNSYETLVDSLDQAPDRQITIPREVLHALANLESKADRDRLEILSRILEWFEKQDDRAQMAIINHLDEAMMPDYALALMARKSELSEPLKLVDQEERTGRSPGVRRDKKIAAKKKPARSKRNLNI